MLIVIYMDVDHHPNSGKPVMTTASIARPMGMRTSRGRLLALLTALSTLGLLATNLYLPSLPGLAAGLSASADEVRTTLTVFLAGLALGQLVVGPLSDRFGRRPLLLLGLALYVASSLACAMAQSVEQLLVLRAAQAIGACAGVVVVRAVARDLFSGADLTRAMAVIATLMATAPGFSPLLGGLIETVWGWRGNFVFIAAFGAACLALTLAWLGETNGQPARRLDPRGIAQVYAMLAGSRPFLGPALASACAIGALFGYFSASPQLIIEILGFSPLGFGLLTAGTVFAVFAGGAAGPRLARRLGTANALKAGMGLMIVGGGGMALLFAGGRVDLLTFLLPQILFLVGLGIVNPVGTAAALQPYPQAAGAASALLGFAQMGFGALATLILSFLPVAMPLALPLVMAGLAALGLLALLLFGTGTLAGSPADIPAPRPKA